MKKSIDSFLNSEKFSDSKIIKNLNLISGGRTVTTSGGTKPSMACPSGCITYTSDTVEVDEWNCEGTRTYYGWEDCKEARLSITGDLRLFL